MVLGDTAFEAQSIRAACAERKFHWIMPLNPERVLAGAKPRPKVRSLAKELHADQMVHLEVHPNRGKYVAYRRIARCRIGPKLKPRTYYVHQEIRDVHSVGEVRLVFSTTKAPLKDQGVDVQKILMTDDLTLSLQDVIELYQLRWQIESFSRSPNRRWACPGTGSSSSRWWRRGCGWSWRVSSIWSGCEPAS